jgi:hypothetical protein
MQENKQALRQAINMLPHAGRPPLLPNEKPSAFMNVITLLNKNGFRILKVEEDINNGTISLQIIPYSLSDKN